jgi:hypothetical protein
MLRNCAVLSILLLACGTLWLGAAAPRSNHQDALQSFYVISFFFSDDLPESFDQILDVTPQGEDVRVRVIRISSANDFCPGRLVRAAEHVFRHTTVTKIAGRDLCAFTPEGVAGALKAAAPKSMGDNSDSATETIVAKCGTQEKEFDFPYPVEVDLKALKQSNPEVDALWDTRYRIYRRALGKSFSFNTPTQEQEKERRDLGTKLVPELISGKYDTAFSGSTCGNEKCDNYLAWELKGYSGPPSQDNQLVVDLLEAASLHLTKYVAPIFPAIAKTAHVSGDVHIRITADPQTGLVTDVQAVSGPQLLWRAAIDAARFWQFAPGSLSGRPVEATLRFELRCPGS